MTLDQAPEAVVPAPGSRSRAALFESVVVHATDVVLVTEAEPVDLASGGPRVLYVNPAFTRMTGYEPHEILGLTPRILQSPKTDRRELDRLGTALRRWRPVEVELLNLRKDGTEFWVQISITPVADETGWWTHWVAVQRDITDRKHRELALQALLDSSSDLVLALDQDGVVTAVSPSVRRLLGTEPSELVGSSLRDLVDTDDAVQTQALLTSLLTSALTIATGTRIGPSPTGELRLRHADGEPRWFAVTVLEPEHPASSTVLTCCDVTARKQGEIALRLADDRFRSAFLDAPIGMAVTAPDGRFLQVNPALTRLLGRDAQELLRLTVHDVTHPDDREPGERQRADLLRGSISRHRFETRFVHADGGVVGVLHSSSVVLPVGDAQMHVVDHVEDITERKAFEAQLQHQALHDPLTGLPNRALLTDRVDRALRASVRSRRPVAVLFLDLDRFKTVNDSYGHHAGDAVLVIAARRLQAALRPGDTVARNGGDEFVVLCEDCTVEQAVATAERFARAFDTPMTVFDAELSISASVGIAVALPDTVTAEELLRDADTAMYAAKDSGRARYEVFDAALGARTSHRLRMEAELRLALADGQFRLDYQPQVRLRDGVVVGLEALVRWQHPQRGLLSPAVFLPLAEDTELIHPLGAWVLDEALRAAAERRRVDAGSPVTWVNLSAHQLRDPGFVEGVGQRLREHGLPGSAIGLEITESVLMHEADGAHDTLLALKRLDVALAIDDFGTGYSSLSYLANFPVDIVKIDQSFTSGLDRDETRRESFAIVSAVVGLAHALGLTVVAEGVETRSQQHALHGLGCETGQGFLLGRPSASGHRAAGGEIEDAGGRAGAHDPQVPQKVR